MTNSLTATPTDSREGDFHAGHSSILEPPEGPDSAHGSRRQRRVGEGDDESASSSVCPPVRPSPEPASAWVTSRSSALRTRVRRPGDTLDPGSVRLRPAAGCLGRHRAGRAGHPHFPAPVCPDTMMASGWSWGVPARSLGAIRSRKMRALSALERTYRVRSASVTQYPAVRPGGGHTRR